MPRVLSAGSTGKRLVQACCPIRVLPQDCLALGKALSQQHFSERFRGCSLLSRQCLNGPICLLRDLDSVTHVPQPFVALTSGHQCTTTQWDHLYGADAHTRIWRQLATLRLHRQHLHLHVADLHIRPRLFYVAHRIVEDLFGVLRLAAHTGEAERGELPLILGGHLGGGDPELVTQARQQRWHHLALALERLTAGPMQGSTCGADEHGGDPFKRERAHAQDIQGVDSASTTARGRRDARTTKSRLRLMSAPPSQVAQLSVSCSSRMPSAAPSSG